MLQGHFNAQVAFVVFKADVVAWSVLLDQVIFQNQGFLLIGRHQGLDILYPAEQKLDLNTPVPTTEVRPHTAPQLLSLPDVNDLTVLVPHQIDAGTRRKSINFFFNGKH